MREHPVVVDAHKFWVKTLAANGNILMYDISNVLYSISFVYHQITIKSNEY